MSKMREATFSLLGPRGTRDPDSFSIPLTYHPPPTSNCSLLYSMHLLPELNSIQSTLLPGSCWFDSCIRYWSKSHNTPFLIYCGFKTKIGLEIWCRGDFRDKKKNMLQGPEQTGMKTKRSLSLLMLRLWTKPGTSLTAFFCKDASSLDILQPDSHSRIFCLVAPAFLQLVVTVIAPFVVQHLIINAMWQCHFPRGVGALWQLVCPEAAGGAQTTATSARSEVRFPSHHPQCRAACWQSHWGLKAEIQHGKLATNQNDTSNTEPVYLHSLKPDCSYIVVVSSYFRVHTFLSNFDKRSFSSAFWPPLCSSRRCCAVFCLSWVHLAF